MFDLYVTFKEGQHGNILHKYLSVHCDYMHKLYLKSILSVYIDSLRHVVLSVVNVRLVFLLPFPVTRVYNPLLLFCVFLQCCKTELLC